jgi:hypothetical protein
MKELLIHICPNVQAARSITPSQPSIPTKGALLFIPEKCVRVDPRTRFTLNNLDNSSKIKYKEYATILKRDALCIVTPQWVSYLNLVISITDTLKKPIIQKVDYEF